LTNWRSAYLSWKRVALLRRKCGNPCCGKPDSHGRCRGNACCSSAATPAPQDPAPASAPAWSVGPIDFSGLVDGYYSFNANHPASQFNQLYNFDVKANQFSLNMAKLSMSHTADRSAFKWT